MSQFDRRDFLRQGTRGLGVLGVGSLLLGNTAAPTEASGPVDEAEVFLADAGNAVSKPVSIPPARVPADLKPTEDNILGPYFRQGSPYRAKITPPMEPGEVLVVRGRVWAHDTKRPLAGAVLDIWQANAKGRYDNDDPKNPPRKGVYLNRARLVADESGYYEYETVKPGRYQIGRNQWRPAHIHYLVRSPGYQTLVTQMYFKGDPMNSKDRFIKRTLITDATAIKTEHGSYWLDTFDIVLAKKG